MTEQPYDDETDESSDQRREPNWRRDLERRAKAGDEAVAERDRLTAEATAARRELAMARLGIDTERGPGKLFAKAYDGEPTLEAMRAEAEAYGLLAPAGAQPPTSAIPPDQQAALQQISQARTGAPSSGTATPDFEAELDGIPMYVKGANGAMEQNYDYVSQVLEAARTQAAREGLEFTTSAGQVTAQKGHSLAGPATTPIRP